jgi:hypothetical protein
MIVAPFSMTTMTKAKRLTRAEIERRLERAWQEMLVENGLVVDLAEAKKLGMEVSKLAPEVIYRRGITLGVALGMQETGKGIAKQYKVKNEEQLQRALAKIKQMGNEMPTLIRKATRMIISNLPRRGGPGRQPKLNAKEASQVIDQILVFIRQKHSVKKALQEVAELTPNLLGKKVSPRTLQKAWDKRDEHPSE